MQITPLVQRIVLGPEGQGPERIEFPPDPASPQTRTGVLIGPQPIAWMAGAVQVGVRSVRIGGNALIVPTALTAELNLGGVSCWDPYRGLVEAPLNDPDVADVVGSVAVNWGHSGGNNTYTAPYVDQLVTHVFPEPGIYRIMVTVNMDDDDPNLLAASGSTYQDIAVTA